MIKIQTNFENVYIFGFGPAGHWSSENISSKVKGFIDNDMKKEGKIFNTNEIEILSSIPNTSIIKGDAKFLSIAAASIFLIQSD